MEEGRRQTTQRHRQEEAHLRDSQTRARGDWRRFLVETRNGEFTLRPRVRELAEAVGEFLDEHEGFTPERYQREVTNKDFRERHGLANLGGVKNPAHTLDTYFCQLRSKYSQWRELKGLPAFNELTNYKRDDHSSLLL